VSEDSSNKAALPPPSTKGVPLEKNQDKIVWGNFSKNPNIFYLKTFKMNIVK